MKLKRIKNERAGYVCIAEIVGFAILIGCIAGMGLAYHHDKVEMREAYQAWVKQTDNPKELTYDEWRALTRANKNQTSVILFTPQ